jgi:hypothetical protein
MKNCNSCLHSIGEEERFCSHCGFDHNNASNSEAVRDCNACGEPLSAEDEFCTGCGCALAHRSLAKVAANACSTCGKSYTSEVRFCEEDGTPLNPAVIPQPQETRSGFGLQLAGLGQSFQAQVNGPLGAQILAFFQRNQALIAVSAACVLAWIFIDTLESVGGEWGYALIVAISIACLASWPFALIRKPGTLQFVGRVDGMIGGLSSRAGDSGSRIGRWILYPITLLGLGAASLSRFARDPFAAASIRVFCYALTVAAVISLIFLAMMVLILLLMLWAGLWILGLMLGDDAPTPKVRLPRDVGRRTGRNQIINEGGSWLTERRKGRVDEDGNIYEGDNWFTEKKVGRIDDDGRIHEGDNWFNEKQVGRTDKDGNTYEGDNWLNEKKVGRTDESGNIYEGDNWFTEKKIGRTEDKD